MRKPKLPRHLVKAAVIAAGLISTAGALPQDGLPQNGVQSRPDPIAELERGDQIASFSVDARFDGAEDQPAGLRFIHDPTGMPIDVLRFDSIPQAMLWVETPPGSDRGEPHTGEHLVLGKGRKARYASLLLDMSMGSNSASTYRSKTIYHFHTAGGRQSFLELIYRFLDALVHPDVTDEEIRREVAHLGVVMDESGTLSLEEKGTVYLEMVSSFEKPGTIIWSEIRRQLYGAGHPLGLESGGRPEAIRTMKPEDMRAFFEHRYHPGETMGLILGLPPQFDLAQFLIELDGILRKVGNGWVRTGADAGRPLAGTRIIDPDWPTLATLPPATPPADPAIVRLPFPSGNSSEPGPVVIGWQPFDMRVTATDASPNRQGSPALSSEDLFRLQALWFVFSGNEASFVHSDLIDGTTRKVGPGISSGGGWVMSMPGHCPMLWLDGVSSEAASEESLAETRRVLTERLRWIASLDPGSPELADFNDKIRTYLTSERRYLLEQIDAPPRFGYRGTGDFWYRHVVEVMREPGFAKDLLRNQRNEDLLRDMETGNPWADLIERLGLDAPPAVMVAAYPDTSMPAALAAAKEERLAQDLAALMRQYETADPQEALQLYQMEFDARTEELDLIEKEIGRPGFLNDPPLTLDETIDSQIEPLVLTSSTGAEHQVPVCLNRFERTSMVDLGLYFDMTGTARENWIYLPILPEIIAELGCWSSEVDPASSDWISYVDLRERLQREVSSLDAAYSTFPGEDDGRVELAVYGTGLGLEEGRASLHWAHALLRSAARLDTVALPRLRDLVNREASNLKQLPLGSEEEWVDNPARAYRYQSDPVYLSTASIFTRLHHLQRLRWRLHEVPTDEVIGPLAVRINEILERWDGSRDGLVAELDLMDAELGAADSSPLAGNATELVAYLRSELEVAPEEVLTEDFTRLAGQALDDLLQPPEAVLAEIRTVVDDLLRQGPSRAHLTGSTDSVDRLWPDLDITIARLTDIEAIGARAEGEGATPPLADASQDAPADYESAALRAGAPSLITRNLRARYPDLGPEADARPPHVALVLESSRSAVFLNSAQLMTYDQPYYSRLIDLLATRSFGGAGVHGLFMQTWGAGLAYSNGVGASLRRGLVSYYAERCNDGVETLRFVGDVLAGADQTLDDEFFLDYALAGCFGDFRGGDTYLSRGRAMANDWADGLSPERIRTFKEALLDLRRKWQNPSEDRGVDLAMREGGLLDQVSDRLPEVVGPVVVGYGSQADERRGSVNMLIGPTSQIEDYEAHLRAHEPDARLLRLYPRDFWVD